MNLKTLLFTKNACYLTGKTIIPKGIMVHSTGANNPNLKRYVGPDDGFLGVNSNVNHWNRNTPDGRQVCVHGFIGKLADGSIATYQTLPWNYRGWHSGGDANNTHISFEICEDGLTDGTYFNKIYQEAIELCTYLCKMYRLDPMKDGVLICHSEGHKRGIASNHSDVMHWFTKHGKNMDTFRAAVKSALSGSVASASSSDTEIKIGTWVEIKADALNYYPGGKKIPAWAIRDSYHRVTQVTSKDKQITKGGKLCVLLGKKIKKSDNLKQAGNAEENGINSWVDKDVLTVVGDFSETYIVKEGDTLWNISATKLGKGERYLEIKSLNGLTGDTIKIGQKLKIPMK